MAQITRAGRELLGEISVALRGEDLAGRFPTVAKVVGPQTHRAWAAAAMGIAIFSVLFWAATAAGKGRLELSEDAELGSYPNLVVISYFAVTVILAPLVAQTVGAWLENWSARLQKDDSVLLFIALGLVLAVPPTLLIAFAAPEGFAIGPAVWLFGAPVVLATSITRGYLDAVLRRPRYVSAVVSLAVLPPVIVVLFLLGLYVAQGSQA